ncbi:hypothetical protein BXY66_1613 [Shimia isoporae]|uniref:Uncharacterized protein n=1 Tax=Shimia isoporae TaxID=647720 RepID=A0A4R1NWP1_9RHOB|nr:hypothetical protein BXY66_1613 [Shimia isoporae]
MLELQEQQTKVTIVARMALVRPFVEKDNVDWVTYWIAT